MLRSKAVLLGSEANKKAESGQYYGAIDLFSKAIELFPFDYRFYLNRAFCYEKTELYHLCLADSEEAIRLNSAVEKCYFRKARALAGLKEWTKAEDAFRHVLTMNPSCQETRDELLRNRCTALVDMGFDKQTAISGANNYESIRAAIDGLLAERMALTDGQPTDTHLIDRHLMDRDFEQPLKTSDNNINNNCFELNSLDINSGPTAGDLYEPSGVKYADKARTWAQLAETQPPVTTSAVTSTSKAGLTLTSILKTSEKLLKPTNIWNYNGLRVENVNIDNKKSLLKRFSAFGKVKGVEVVKNCKSAVWVFFDNPVSPVEAIGKLQGAVHTDINVYHNGEPVPLRMFFAPTNDQTELKFCRPKQPQDNKGECYYWRTTNCSLEDKCPLLHLTVNKHIDAQVWMKTRDGKQV